MNSSDGYSNKRLLSRGVLEVLLLNESLAFRDRQDLVYVRIRNPVDRSAWPANLKQVYFRSLLKSKVDPQITLRQVAAPTANLVFLDQVAGNYFDSCSDTIAIGAEIGLRYQPKPSPAPILEGTGLENINDTGSRWSLPISAFLTLRF